MSKIQRPNLKLCPFCGEAPHWDWDKNKARCSNKHTAWMPVDEWNSRHEEDRESLATHDAEVIEHFKNELVKSVKPIFRPHIEGVCAVVQQQITQQAKEVQS